MWKRHCSLRYLCYQSLRRCTLCRAHRHHITTVTRVSASHLYRVVTVVDIFTWRSLSRKRWRGFDDHRCRVLVKNLNDNNIPQTRRPTLLPLQLMLVMLCCVVYQPHCVVRKCVRRTFDAQSIQLFRAVEIRGLSCWVVRALF